MASKRLLDTDTVDGLLKAMLVFSRTIDYVLESRAIQGAHSKHLSSSKVQILRLLGQRGQQTPTRVARFLGVSRPAVTQLIDSMERSRLVARRTATGDRREANLTLTKQGTETFRTLRRQQRHCIRQSLRLQPTGEAKRWIRVLEGLTVSLAGAEQTFEEYCLQCGAYEDGNCVLIGGDSDCLFLQHRRKSSKDNEQERPKRRAAKKNASAKTKRARRVRV